MFLNIQAKITHSGHCIFHWERNNSTLENISRFMSYFRSRFHSLKRANKCRGFLKQTKFVQFCWNGKDATSNGEFIYCNQKFCCRKGTRPHFFMTKIERQKQKMSCHGSVENIPASRLWCPRFKSACLLSCALRQGTISSLLHPSERT